MIVLVLLIIIALLHKNYPFLDDMAYLVIVGIIISISLIYIIYSIWGLMHKDKYNYDEDDYIFNNKTDTGIDICNNAIDMCLQYYEPELPNLPNLPNLDEISFNMEDYF